MSNFFSSDEYYAAYAKTVFSDGRFEIDPVAIGGKTFRLFRRDNNYLLRLPFQDFYEPVDEPPRTRTVISYLPNVCLQSIPVEEWLQRPPSADNATASPWTDWTKFNSFDEFVKSSHTAHNRAFSKNTRYQYRRIEREIGPISFDFTSADKSMLELCFEWKSAKVRATGLVDAIAEGTRTRTFFKTLFDQGLLTMAVMKAGDIPLAIHVGAVYKDRLYYWVPAFDAAYSIHSAGTILLEYLFEWSYSQGHRQFDFLAGDEPYKFFYATDIRVIQPIGTPPLSERIWKPIRARLIVHLRKHKKIYDFAQSTKRRILTKLVK